MLGVVLDIDSIDRGDLDRRRLRASLPHWEVHGRVAGPEVGAAIATAAVVVTNKVPLDAAAMDAARALRLICVAATGVNNVDLAAARARNITVCNVRGYATASVVQHVFALVLALTTRLPQYQAAVRAGRWQESAHFCLLDYPIRELHGLTFGVVGYGELGRAVAGVAAAFGMEVLIAERRGTAPRAGRIAVDELLRRADVVSLHCPLTAETRGLIGARELALMKPDALLINTARGGIVDERALVAALRGGRLGGAGVDVLSVEPPNDDQPLLQAEIPNLIVTPHIAWASRASRQRVLDEVAHNIEAFVAGHPRNVVD